jgi:hypothetical protein
MVLHPKVIIPNKLFIGREYEIEHLTEIGNAGQPAIVVMYGRRRVGKTELLEQVYRERNIIKFEGIKGKSESEQMTNVLWQLSEYLNAPPIAKIQVSTWTEVFKLICDYIPEGKWTLYFEEVQWLADYKPTFISELKYAWDNYFKNKSELILILCCSSPSFIINEVLLSQALYNRSQHEFHLRELSLRETKQFMHQRSNRELMDAYLLVGGIPEYLKWLNNKSSVMVSLCQNSFRPASFFLNEVQRIFVSSLADKKHYKAIIEFLAQRRFATRDTILNNIKVASSGATTALLVDLELCGFIEKYTPYQLDDESTLNRYCISDAYLQFYYKFIKPIKRDIEHGDFISQPTSAIKTDSFYKWLGYAFERLCRRKHRIIAKILGFSAVHYRSGVYFNRQTNKDNPGYQLDLVFDRDDKVITLCEIRYLQGSVGVGVIQEFENKLALFENKKNKTLHKVLITTEGADNSLIRRAYFDDVITIDQLIENE